MPTGRAQARARKDRREGKPASTQAGEFVREQVERLHEGAEGVRSTAQAVAIGLSQARRAGIKVPAKKSVRDARRSRDVPVTPDASTTRPARAKRKASTKKTPSTRAAGATRAARKRAMRARTR